MLVDADDALAAGGGDGAGLRDTLAAAAAARRVRLTVAAGSAAALGPALLSSLSSAVLISPPPPPPPPQKQPQQTADVTAGTSVPAPPISLSSSAGGGLGELLRPSAALERAWASLPAGDALLLSPAASSGGGGGGPSVARVRLRDHMAVPAGSAEAGLDAAAAIAGSPRCSCGGTATPSLRLLRPAAAAPAGCSMRATTTSAASTAR